jgi:hypothetical protein
MKNLYILLLFLLQGVEAHAIWVKGVKVSVTDESAANAREKAIQQAHQAAFQKLFQENFPENTMSTPSLDKIEDMVTDFSIDQEKTTPTSYAASLTFQFDDIAVQEWLRQVPGSSLGAENAAFFQQGREPLKAEVKYETHSEWRKIKNALEKTFGVQGIDILVLSPKGATIHLIHRGDTKKLQKDLQGENITLTSQGDGWVVRVGGSQ